MNQMEIDHPHLFDSRRKAYSAEKAASFAYIGHAGSLKSPEEKERVRQIEQDEWDHRRNILKIMQQYLDSATLVHDSRVNVCCGLELRQIA